MIVGIQAMVNSRIAGMHVGISVGSEQCGNHLPNEKNTEHKRRQRKNLIQYRQTFPPCFHCSASGWIRMQARQASIVGREASTHNSTLPVKDL
jgi:hypothetical protein